MTERRSKLEIVGDMLKSIQAKGGSIKPTHLLYKSNLSHERMKLYVDELKSKGLLEEKEEKGRRFFSITDRALNFFQATRRSRSLKRLLAYKPKNYNNYNFYLFRVTNKTKDLYTWSNIHLLRQ